MDAQGKIRPSERGKAAGFSLVELIVVIVISGVLAGAVATFIAGPIQGFFDQARRGHLVDAAQLALLRMGRDLHAALPNSVRVSGGVIELLLTLDGERYRAEPPGDVSGDDQLNFAAPDGRFNTFAPLSPPTVLTNPYSVTGSLAIYPLNQAGANPYEAPVALGAGQTRGTMTPSETFSIQTSTVGGNTEYQVSMPASHQFPIESPTRRVFLVQGPVSWLCDGTELVRYDGYATQPAQPASVAALGALAGAVRTVVARDVQACNFQFSDGGLRRNAVAVISVVLATAANPAERVRLIRQVHVDNTP